MQQLSGHLHLIGREPLGDGRAGVKALHEKHHGQGPEEATDAAEHAHIRHALQPALQDGHAEYRADEEAWEPDAAQHSVHVDKNAPRK